jgi:hypothetical protein
LPFKFVLEYAIRSFQVNEGGLKLSGTYQLLAYADDVHVFSGRYILQSKTQKLL